MFATFKYHKFALKEAMVPKSIDQITISATVPFAIGTKFRGYSNASKYGFQELQAELIMLDEGLTTPVVSVKGFYCA